MPFPKTFAGAVVAAAAVIGVLALEPIPVYTHTPITTNITFQKEISRIFQRRCMQCHSDGNIAMSFATYADARPWAVAIKEEILERKMPPWSAVAGYGHFANDGGLTSREVSVILSWATGGAPSGVLKAEETTPPVMVPPLNGWTTGEPDAVVEVGNGHMVPAGSGNTTMRFEVDSGFTAPTWLRGLQFDPADRRVPQWAAVYEAGTGRWLGGWTAITPVTKLPDGVAAQLPAKAKLVVEVGYRGATEAVTGAGSLGLYFAKTKPAAVTEAVSVVSNGTSVPPGATGQRVRVEKAIAQDSMAGILFPELGAGGRSLEVMAIRPDGMMEPLLWVERYQAQWRSPYVLREPVALPAGTRVIMTAYFDNPRQAAQAADARLSVTAWPASRQTATRR
jgi:hypothetical protein